MIRIASQTISAAVLAVFLSACHGAHPESSARVGPQGGTLTTQGGFSLSIPAGALSREVEIRVSEAQPRDGATQRFELEPRDLVLDRAATISVRSDDAAHMKLVEVENEVEHGIETERHNPAEHAREAEIEHLGTVELRHAAVCATACGAGLECDDGVCKPHGGAAVPGAVPPNADGTCPAGLELEPNDGICKPHGGAAVPGAVPPNADGTCPAGLELEPNDGICKPHGGSGGGSGK